MIKDSHLPFVVGHWAANCSLSLLVQCHILKGTLELKVFPTCFQLLFTLQTETLMRSPTVPHIRKCVEKCC